MSRKMTRGIVVTLSLVLLTALFTVGSATGDSSAPAMSATIKYVYIGQEPTDQPAVTAALEAALAEDNLNFKLDFVFIPDDEYVNKLVLIVVAGEEYDICWTMPVNIGDLADKGGLAPLDEALSKYGQPLLNALPEASWKEVTFGGKIYGVPGLLPAASMDMNLQIRKDLREKYGIPEIVDLEGLETYLRAYHEDVPSGYPMANESGRILFREYGEIFTPIGKELKSPVCISLDDPTYTAQHFYKSDTFLKTIAKIREWHSEGLYEIDVIKDDHALYAAGQIGAMWATSTLHERIGYFKANRTDPDAMIENIMLHPDKPKHLFGYGMDNLCVFSTSKYVDECVAFINWIRGSQEAYDLMSYGVEGVNYNLDGEGVSYDGIPDDKLFFPQNWMWSDIRFMRFDGALDASYGDMLRSWDDGCVVYPWTGFTMNREPVNMEITQIIALQEEYVPQLKNSKLDFESTYETFLKKLDEAGIEKVIAEVQKQMEEFMAK